MPLYLKREIGYSKKKALKVDYIKKIRFLFLFSNESGFGEIKERRYNPYMSTDTNTIESITPYKCNSGYTPYKCNVPPMNAVYPL